MKNFKKFLNLIFNSVEFTILNLEYIISITGLITGLDTNYLTFPSKELINGSIIQIKEYKNKKLKKIKSTISKIVSFLFSR